MPMLPPVASSVSSKVGYLRDLEGIDDWDREVDNVAHCEFGFAGCFVGLPVGFLASLVAVRGISAVAAAFQIG